MEFEKVAAAVGRTPYISRKGGRFLYDLILEERCEKVLELGIAHGTATCYMAAALHELGRGSVTAVDLIEAKEFFSPTAEEQLERAGLTQFASIVRMQTGYTWFLHDEIARNTAGEACRPIYDLCVIDGPKNWTIDGAAFFFVDKLLKPGGWILFDDYDWSYAKSGKGRDVTDGITHRRLSPAELETPHIREVFELLVKQHPHYGRLVRIDEEGWALAQKTECDPKSYTVVYSETVSSLFAKVASRVYRAVRSARVRR
jgi:predicted O-methyltransferase YrrM